MISTHCVPQESLNLTSSAPDKTTPELRPWSTPHVQRLNGAARDTQAGAVHWTYEDTWYQPS
jgi:hypothetical protein